MSLTKENNNNSVKSLDKLIRVMRTDTVINKKVTEVLQLDAYNRHHILNNWLELLRIQHASQNLLNALSCLFDDKVAARVLEFINKNH